MKYREEGHSGAQRLLKRVTADILPEHNPVTCITELPSREPQFANMPPWVSGSVIDALPRNGVAHPWAHQIEAASLAWSEQDVILATGTSSGKSLAYQLPVLSTPVTNPKA